MSVSYLCERPMKGIERREGGRQKSEDGERERESEIRRSGGNVGGRERREKSE